MSNLLTVLSSSFDTTPYTHILPSLERNLISTADLLTLEPVDVAKRAQVPPGEVKKLVDAVIEALHGDLFAKSTVPSSSEFHHAADVAQRWDVISTMDDTLDEALNGGIACGHLTEIVGESAAGKTQVLLTLLLSAQIPSLRQSQSPSTSSPPPSALYISTEAPLQTTRLTQILTTHPVLKSLAPSSRPSLSRIHSTHIHDLEAQDHILRFQVPVAIQKHNVRLLVIDSVAANFRAESTMNENDGSARSKGFGHLAKRSAQLAQTGALLRDLARKFGIAVVVANQVADRFSVSDNGYQSSFRPPKSQQSTQHSTSQQWRGTSPAGRDPPQHRVQHQRQPYPPTKPEEHPPSLLSTSDPLSLDHQQNFFTGWGDDPEQTMNMKTPSLGLTWTNQLSTRIALIKVPIYDYANLSEAAGGSAGEGQREVGVKWTRRMKVVFSGWCPASSERRVNDEQEGQEGDEARGKHGVEVEIWRGGVRSLRGREREMEAERADVDKARGE